MPGWCSARSASSSGRTNGASVTKQATRIRVACFVTLAPFVLPELLADLAEHHPGIEVEVIETEAESLGAALRSGSAEIALTYDLGLGGEIERQVTGQAEPHVIPPPE